jgi:hypothetical protein
MLYKMQPERKTIEVITGQSENCQNCNEKIGSKGDKSFFTIVPIQDEIGDNKYRHTPAKAHSSICLCENCFKQGFTRPNRTQV